MWADDAIVAPWGAILVAAGVFLGGALTKVGELISVWHKSRTDARVAELKAQAEAEAQGAAARAAGEDRAYQRLTDHCERIDRDLRSAREQIARQDAHISSGAEELALVRREHAACQADQRELREYLEQVRASLQQAGHVLPPLPALRPAPRPAAQREFLARQLEQSRRSLLAVTNDLLADDPAPSPPSPPRTSNSETPRQPPAPETGGQI